MLKKLLILVFVVLPLLPVHAQDEEGSLFQMASERAVVFRDGSQFSDPGAALYHDGKFHMFANRFNGWVVKNNIFYWQSDDGIAWEKLSNAPVFNEVGVDYAGYALLASSALVEDDGTWVLYFYTWASTDSYAETSIGRATADNPLGPWTADPAPLITIGSADEWDDAQVFAPTVVKSEDGYVMYYTGSNLAKVMRIGMATSEDGITWTKYDDPATVEAPYAESDPIIAELGNPDESRRKQEIWQPRVQITPDGWVMFYKHGDQFYSGGSQHGYGISEDGITWELVYDVVPITPQDAEGNAIWFSELVYADDTYYYFIEVGKFVQGAGNTTETYLATYTGSLPH